MEKQHEESIKNLRKLVKDSDGKKSDIKEFDQQKRINELTTELSSTKKELVKT